MRRPRIIPTCLTLLILATNAGAAQTSGWTIALDSTRIVDATLDSVGNDTLVISPLATWSVYGIDPGSRIPVKDIVYVTRPRGSTVGVGAFIGLLAGGLATLALSDGDFGGMQWLPIGLGPIIGLVFGAIAQPPERFIVLEGRNSAERSEELNRALWPDATGSPTATTPSKH